MTRRLLCTICSPVVDKGASGGCEGGKQTAHPVWTNNKKAWLRSGTIMLFGNLNTCIMLDLKPRQ